MSQCGLAVLLAFSAALVFTRMARRAALYLGVLDLPDHVRKFHGTAVPLLGGVAVYAAWVVGMLGTCLCRTTAVPAGGHPDLGMGFSLYLAASVVVFMGVLDDIIGLRARWKLLGQSVAAAVLLAGGLVVKRLWFFGYTIELGWLGPVLMLVWLVGSMNAMNMLDGLDGLAASVGLITCLSLALMSWLTQAAALTLVSVSFAGALAGFLLYNLPPARIFLGDAGSNLLGLIIGAVAIRGSFKGPATAALAVPVLVLTIPIFDGVAAVLRRRLTGVPISVPDCGHIHHQLRERGWSDKAVLASVAVLCAGTSSAALVSVYVQSEPLAILATAAVVVSCVVTRIFGYYEYSLLFRGPRLLRRALRVRLGGHNRPRLNANGAAPAQDDQPASEARLGGKGKIAA